MLAPTLSPEAINAAAAFSSTPIGTLDSSVTPPADANLAIVALDREITPDFKPLSPASHFAAGFTRIYFFVEFSALATGMLWRGALLENGGVINHFDRLWSSTPDGTGYFFFTQKDGFAAGSYEIRLYLGQSTTPIARASFTVSG